MKFNKENLTIISNLYPLPWEPNRATFNRQQFSQLDETFNCSVLVPVAFIDWFKHHKQIKQSEQLRYVPYFYPPKFGRRLYSYCMFLSIFLHSGLWLKRRNNHILLASWAFPEAVATKWLSQLFHCKFFFKVHGNDINLNSKTPARAKQIKNAAKHALGILSVSKALKNEMINMGIEKEKIHVIYNGVNHDKFNFPANTCNKENYILYVGNLKKAKGIFELIDGFSKIHINFPDLKLVFAGPGVMKQQLMERAINHNIKDKVELLGSVNHNDLPQLMRHARLVALPSYNEGVPNVLLESMACGTPVLASNVGGIPEIVDLVDCGVLIPPMSSGAVAKGLTQTLNKKWSRKLIIEHSQRFTWSKNKKQLIKMLETKVNES